MNPVRVHLIMITGSTLKVPVLLQTSIFLGQADMSTDFCLHLEFRIYAVAVFPSTKFLRILKMHIKNMNGTEYYKKLHYTWRYVLVSPSH